MKSVHFTVGGATFLRHGSSVDVGEQASVLERRAKRGAKSKLRAALEELSRPYPGTEIHSRDRRSPVLRESARGLLFFFLLETSVYSSRSITD